LTSNSGGDYVSAWSPDGKRIAFASFWEGKREIYVMNADGSGRTNLTRNSAEDDWPAWSPFLVETLAEPSKLEGPADPSERPPTPSMITLHIREASGLRVVRIPDNCGSGGGGYVNCTRPDGTDVLLRLATPPFSIERIFGPDGRERIPKAAIPGGDSQIPPPTPTPPGFVPPPPATRP
ncbi:MAG: hypothetical protein Q8O76_03355, partial [Chloroflexota bacterium]|nr:hypothetical protein [Chloroflexota bacterium]